MNILIRAMVVAGMLTVVGNAVAESFPASISREPLVAGRVSDRLSVGVGYDKLERGVEFDDLSDAVLEANTIHGYVGYDALPWLTAFVTAGGIKVKEMDGADYGLKVSAGASAYLWEGDVLVPAFMAGRLSIKAMGEISRSESDTDFGRVEWLDVMVALPVGYEKFDRYPVSSSGMQASLALYAGPAYSYLRGKVDSRFSDINFEGSQDVGVVAGADVYFSPSVSIGAKVVAFDEVSYGASARFHF